MDAIGRGELAALVLAHRDQLTRFGYDWFAHYAALRGCELLVLNQERLSPGQEVAQVLMTIVHCFSSRQYGLHNYRRQLRAALESDHAAGAPDQD
jgi:predicted site-specific integrase-resolvase